MPRRVSLNVGSGHQGSTIEPLHSVKNEDFFHFQRTNWPFVTFDDFASSYSRQKVAGISHVRPIWVQVWVLGNDATFQIRNWDCIITAVV